MSVTRVLFTEPEVFDNRLRSELPNYWDCTFKYFSNESELLEYVGLNSFDIVFARLGLFIGPSFFKISTATKLIATPTTGLDHIDLKAAEAAGTHVLSLRGEIDFLRSITSTAEHAWGLLIACNRQIPALIDRTRNGHWARGDFELNQLSDKTLGIIGLGRLGLMVADYGQSFRMNVLAYDPYVTAKDFPITVEKVNLDKLLSESDHIILTASYTAGDPIILDRKEILSIKRAATFINVSRGELVDELALVEAIDLGVLRAVGVDVLPGDSKWAENEQVDSPLIQKSRETDLVLVTPHVGGYAKEAIIQTRRFIVQCVKQYTKIKRIYDHENNC